MDEFEPSVGGEGEGRFAVVELEFHMRYFSMLQLRRFQPSLRLPCGGGDGVEAVMPDRSVDERKHCNCDHESYHREG